MTDARLLIDPPLAGPANMARDEALLAACTAPSNRPTLRFYAWSPATISLGYFQTIDELHSQPPAIRELPVVRRTTGGGAILHDLEVTYSIVVPIDHPLIAGRPNRLYELAHEAIIAVVGSRAQRFGCDESGESCDSSSQRGPFFCFARRHALDVVVPDADAPGGFAKLAGSAQRRTRTAILQHGSIMLDSRFTEQTVATWRGLDDVQGLDVAVDRLTPCFARAMNWTLTPDSWRDEELAAAKPFERMYASDAWTIHRERHT
ncbi:Octanoyltransferase LipM [Phycisphaerae bacterium RAS2]|nr:Octanoyltransferase LipM [Phycisphaerae bacterium RAS2]